MAAKRGAVKSGGGSADEDLSSVVPGGGSLLEGPSVISGLEAGESQVVAEGADGAEGGQQSAVGAVHSTSVVRGFKGLAFKYTEVLCSKCSKEVVAFMSDPCRCFSVCKPCAMRMATGGKCKICGQFFAGFKLIVPGKLPAAMDPDDD